MQYIKNIIANIFQRNFIYLISFVKSILDIVSNSSKLSSSTLSSSLCVFSKSIIFIFLNDDNKIIKDVIAKNTLGFENNIIMGKINNKSNIIRKLSNCINFHL